MKHIAIIPNYSGITGMVRGGDISPNFLVKSSNDGKVHFSNAAGYQIITSGGDVYNMYINNSNELEVAMTSDGFSFQLVRDGVPITAVLDVSALADCDGTIVEDASESQTGVTNFVFMWTHGETSWQINYDPVYNLVQAITKYYYTEEETCEYYGGTWNPETGECEMPEPEDPCEGYESQEECECVQQGGTWEGSECHFDGSGCDGDPECECSEQGGTWTGSECHFDE